uniref:Uncharacterized protein n=1 Tax=Anguilla anguilla TaxID=7936 RepID=A0A0E9TKA9_ANGAN
MRKKGSDNELRTVEYRNVSVM